MKQHPSPRRMLAATLLLLACLSATWAQTQPSVHILATGGTIAGVASTSGPSQYKAAQVGIETLLAAVPQVQTLARVTGEQLAWVASQDMTDALWLKLHQRIEELLAQEEVAGVVVTHGTDTMEETAFFLSLTLKSRKPVVLVGAMRPATALSADGPANLYNAVAVASSASSAQRGVMVAMNGCLLSPQEATKKHTLGVEAFGARDGGAMGRVDNGRVSYYAPTTPPPPLHFDLSGLSELPRVGIVYGHAGICADALLPYVGGGYRGVIYAGVGNGNMHRAVMEAVAAGIERQGLAVVRATRVPTGPTTPEGETDDASLGLVAAQRLNAHKARVLLQLLLSRETLSRETLSREEMQRSFDYYR